jgi:hypothetical protein
MAENDRSFWEPTITTVKSSSRVCSSGERVVVNAVGLQVKVTNDDASPSTDV